MSGQAKIGSIERYLTLSCCTIYINQGFIIYKI